MKDENYIAEKVVLKEIIPLVDEIGNLIEAAKHRITVAVNSELTMLNWHIGKSLHTFVLKGKRAAYGEQILSTVSKELTERFGTGFSVPLLSRMLSFVDLFPVKKLHQTIIPR